MHQNQFLAFRINIFSKLISSGERADRRSDKLSENFPISKKLKVQNGTTIYKTDTWWSAVLVMESLGRKQIAVHLWKKKGDEWKMWQKLVISSKDNWTRISEALEKYLEQNKALKTC